MKKYNFLIFLILLLPGFIFGQSNYSVADPVYVQQKADHGNLNVEFDQYAQFESDNYVVVPNNDDMNFNTGDFSVELYFKFNKAFSSVEHGIYTKKITAGYLLYSNSTAIIAYFHDGTDYYSANFSISTLGLTDGVVYHMVVKADRDDDVYLYVNGAEYPPTSTSGTWSSVGSVDNTSHFYIGLYSTRNLYGDMYLTRVYNKALSTSEITDLYEKVSKGDYSLSYNLKNASQTDFTVNGGFSTNTDWTKGTGWTISSGVASCDGTQTSTTDIYQGSVNVKYNKTYRITFTITSYTAGSIRARLASNSYGIWRTATGTYTEYLTVTGTTTALGLVADSDFVGSVDNFSITYTGNISDYQFNNSGNNLVKDMSSNQLDGTVYGTTSYGENSTFWENQNTYWNNRKLNLTDDNISSSSGTTTLLKMQPGSKLTELWINVDSAFVSSDILKIGTVDNDSVVTKITGLDQVGVQKITLDFIGSMESEKQLYIKKNQATSQGSLDVYARFELVEEKRK